MEITTDFVAHTIGRLYLELSAAQARNAELQAELVSYLDKHVVEEECPEKAKARQEKSVENKEEDATQTK